MKSIQIPQEILPKDGRFGSGPSLVPNVAIKKLVLEADKYMGNSHRKANVLELVERFQEGCRDFFKLPEDWSVLLGNGGTTLFWDALSICGIEKKSQHLSFGEFSTRFLEVAENAPHLESPQIIEAEPGTSALPVPNDEVDFYALTHNETSTGVAAEILRPADNGLVAVDATSGAGGIEWDPSQADIYYFSLQKGFASDGGLWVACCSPKAIERFQKLSGERWCPTSLDLNLAYENSIKHQTLNTPAIATIYLALHFVEWALDNAAQDGKKGTSGLNWAAKRSKTSTGMLYDWAEKCKWASPFVKNPKDRSPVVATIDLADSISAPDMASILRENGIVDIEPYRKLNRNQLRFGLFPIRNPEDVKNLIACLDFVANALI